MHYNFFYYILYASIELIIPSNCPIFLNKEFGTSVMKTLYYDRIRKYSDVAEYNSRFPKIKSQEKKKLCLNWEGALRHTKKRLLKLGDYICSWESVISASFLKTEPNSLWRTTLPIILSRAPPWIYQSEKLHENNITQKLSSAEKLCTRCNHTSLLSLSNYVLQQPLKDPYEEHE